MLRPPKTLYTPSAPPLASLADMTAEELAVPKELHA